LKLDEIQDIEVLRKALKDIMCRCIKEIELENYRGDKKIISLGEYLKFEEDDGGYYVITDEEGYSINEYDIDERYNYTKSIEDYFEFPKEGE
jgi:hypothetical protein